MNEADDARAGQGIGGTLVKPATATLTIRRKGFLLIAIPLIAQFAFGIAILSISRKGVQAHDWELHSQQVLSRAYSLKASLLMAQTSLRGYVLTQKPDFRAQCVRAESEVPVEIAALLHLVSDNPAQTRRVRAMARTADDFLKFQNECAQLVEQGRSAEASERIGQQLGTRLMDRFLVPMNEFLTEEESLANARHSQAYALNRVAYVIVTVGLLLNVVLVGALSAILTSGINRRLHVLSENARRLAKRQPLLAPLSPGDEIAEVDRVFPEMATALKKAEEGLDRFFTISLEMLCIAGLDGYFKRLNPAWEATLGHSNEELCAHPWLYFVHPDDVEKTIAEGQKLADGLPAIRFENRYRCADGSYRWLLWNASTVPGSDLIYAAATDITEAKRFHQALGERNTALQAANRDLESFSYTVSHDLRAPLRAVDGYARILEEEYAGALDEEGLRLLSVVRSEARRMGMLIDDLLAFSRFGRQSLTVSQIDLRQLGEEIMREVRTRNSDRTIDFVCADLPPALADRATLRQVLVNLLTNATKYAKPEGDIRIELGGQRDEAHNIYWVRDNGIGFDMRYAEKIFGVFQRLHNDQQFEGTGVGLAIVERIITRHGGRVWAESEPGKGATFFFSLPAADDQRTSDITGSEQQQREAVNE
jgi:PAS domain S-box-containing protein